MLKHDLHHIVLLFLILVDHDNGFGVVGHLFVDHLCCIGGSSGDGAKHFLDFLHGVVHINVAHHNHGLVVGTIPLLIVVAEFFVFEIVDHTHQTDRHALAILRTRVEFFEVAFQQALAGSRAQAPFFVNHAAFLVDFLIFQEQAIRPVFDDEQARVESALACGRHIVDIIHGLVDRSVGIEVATKFHTEGAGVVDQAIAGVIFGTIESHVFKEVSQTTLTFFFLNRAHALSDVEIHMVLGIIVVTNIVSESVSEFAYANGGVGRHIRNGLCLRRNCHESKGKRQ